MKKFLPFVFPLIALIIVIFLAYRWYSTQTMRGETQGASSSQFAEGEKIDNLSASQIKNTPAKDEKTVEMQGVDNAMGQIRYEIKDGKVAFTVTADLPHLTDGSMYQVWLKQVDGDAKRPAFVLEYTKGGYIGSAAISADTLPFDVIVSKETSANGTMAVPILRGTIEKDQAK